jgi:hypothetical protein
MLYQQSLMIALVRLVVIFTVLKGAVIIYGGGWQQRENGWVNKILSK